MEWQQNRNKLTLTWKECGGPLVSVPENKGFGNQLIATCLRSLDGTIRQFFMPEGFACSMNLCLGTNNDEVVTSRIAGNVAKLPEPLREPN